MSLNLLYFLHTLINHLHQTQKTLQLKAYQIGNNMEMQMIVVQQYNCLRMIYVKNDLNAVSYFKITREAQLMLVFLFGCGSCYRDFHNFLQQDMIIEFMILKIEKACTCFFIKIQGF